MVLFDWDDTLFPTHFCGSVLEACRRGGPDFEQPISADNCSFFPHLVQYEEVLQRLLRTASSLAHVGIVTLGTREWVAKSVRCYLPKFGGGAQEGGFFRFLEDHGITIKYAREHVSEREIAKAARLRRGNCDEGYNLWMVAKKNAMLEFFKVGRFESRRRF